MNAYWKAGDRALCVEQFLNKDIDSLKSYQQISPAVGTTYLVLGFDVRYSKRLKREFGGIELSGMDGLWLESRFRKIVPACDRVAQEQKQEATT